MTTTIVVATGQQPFDGPALARSVRALAEAGYDPVVVAPPAVDVASALALALAVGPSRAGRRAVPVVAHVLIDPLDPALACPPGTASPEPLAVLEAEAIAALVGSGFAVVVADQRPVVPHGPPPGSGGVPQSEYRATAAALDPAGCARRLAGDLGAGVLVFVTGDDGPTWNGDVDVAEAERHLAADPPYPAELLAATRFLRAGGELAVLAPAPLIPAALSSAAISPVALAPVALSSAAMPPGAADEPGVLRIHRTLVRPRSDAPVFAAGWC